MNLSIWVCFSDKIFLMHLVYIDDSKGDRHVCFSALVIDANQWRNALDHLLEMRRAMKASHGIYVKKEMHATDWLGGRGRIADRHVSIAERVSLFNLALSQISEIPTIQILNAIGHKRSEETVFEFLLNRLQKNMQVNNSKAMILCDEGKTYDALLRKMRHHNHIPSRFGAWDTGKSSKNIALQNIVEDISYRNSKRSFFIQAADFCAFSLLRKEFPTDRLMSLGVHKSFDLLDKALVKKASYKDPQGIIRI